MSTQVTVALGSGKAVVTGDQGAISVQRYDSNNQALGGPQVIAQSHGLSGSSFFAVAVAADSVSATALTNGGMEIVFNESLGDSSGIVRQSLVGVGLDANGAIIANSGLEPTSGLTPGNLRLATDTLPLGGKISLATPTAPRLTELDGGRFALSYDTFDAQGRPTAHVAFGTQAGLFSDTVVASRPDVITPGIGDVTLGWSNGAGAAFVEVLGTDGSVLQARSNLGQDYVFSIAAPGTVVDGFDAARDRLAVVSAYPAYAHGPASTLTFDARDHSLTWDQDSEGPAAPVKVGVLNGTDTLGVANLEPAFRPEVLKVIAPDGSMNIRWFDSDSSQAWETLQATYNAAGQLKTYAPTLDDGTRTVWNFDPENAQPWQRYVDHDDAAGHVLVREVLLDDGQSWTARFAFANGQVVSYEVDSYDAAGRLVSVGFFNADGTVLAH